VFITKQPCNKILEVYKYTSEVGPFANNKHTTNRLDNRCIQWRPSSLQFCTLTEHWHSPVTWNNGHWSKYAKKAI